MHATPTLHGLPFPFQAFSHAIVVNRDAQRFVCENDYNIGEYIDQRNEDGSPRNLPAHVIADARRPAGRPDRRG